MIDLSEPYVFDNDADANDVERRIAEERAQQLNWSFDDAPVSDNFPAERSPRPKLDVPAPQPPRELPAGVPVDEILCGDNLELIWQLPDKCVNLVITSLVKKIETPTQDVRRHKVEMPGGYSGRSYDNHFVTPFLARRGHFPRYAMKSGSGWLTRSIEQNHPFTLDFPGNIKNREAKAAFLQILHDIEANNQDAKPYLVAIFVLLRRQAKAGEVEFSRISVEKRILIKPVVAALKNHFFSEYIGHGASRLPVIAIHAVYSLLIPRSERYNGKTLLPLKSHTTSDYRSASVGDVEIIDDEGRFFEAVEVKHGIPISPRLVEDAFEKFRPHPINRFYLLTTATPNISREAEVDALVGEIVERHGCEVMPNDVLFTLKYYLRLAGDPAAFVAAYTDALRQDYEVSTDLKEVHLRRWEEILKESGLTG